MENQTDYPFLLRTAVFHGITYELWGSTDVSVKLLHSRAQGRLVGLSCQFSQAPGLRTVLPVPHSPFNTHFQIRQSTKHASL